MSTPENANYERMFAAMYRDGIGERDILPPIVNDADAIVVDLGKYASQITFGNFVDYVDVSNIDTVKHQKTKDVTDLGEYAECSTFGKHHYKDWLKPSNNRFDSSVSDK